MIGLLIPARAFHFAGGMVLVGVVAFRWLVLLPAFARAGEGEWLAFQPFFRLLHRLFFGAGIVVLLSGAALFWAVSAGMSGASLPGALTPDTLGTVLFQTQFGRVTQWRLGFALVLFVLMVKLARDRWSLRRRPSISEGLAGLAAVALAVSFAWTGHAAASAGPGLGWKISADALHLFASSVWPAGLLPFALFLRHARRLAIPFSSGPAPAVARRFSALSFLAVGFLIATGLLNAIFLVGRVSALWTTPYGRILSFKIILFLLMLGFAASNRYRLVPALVDNAAVGDSLTASRIARRLQRFVAAEIALAAVVVIVTAVLGTTPPPQ